MSMLGKRKQVVNELLVQGKDYATQLKLLLQNQNQNNNNPVLGVGPSSAKELVTNVLRSFSDTLSVIMNSSEHDDQIGSTNNDLRTEDSSESSRKRSLLLLTNTKDRRGSYKRRKTDETRTIMSQTTDVDSQAWRKYGQKEILNSQFPRNYFRCSRKHDQGCRATKQVQQIQENPNMYKITYIGFHTCKASAEVPLMLTYSDTKNWIVNYQPADSTNKVPNYEHDPPAAVKQEYPNEESTTISDLTDNLDLKIWSELKDFELSKPATITRFNKMVSDTHVYSCAESQNLELDFGVFSSDFDFQFDQSHLI